MIRSPGDFKLAFNVIDGHVACGDRSHAELIGPKRVYDNYVRAIVAPDVKAIYFRFYAPRYDGMGMPTAEDMDGAFEAAERARKAFVRHGFIRKSWKAVYWDKARAEDLGMTGV